LDNKVFNYNASNSIGFFFFNLYDMLQPIHDQWVRHHDMARPQVADGGTAFRYGVQLRIYWIISRGHPTRGGPTAWGWAMCQELLTAKKL